MNVLLTQAILCKETLALLSVADPPEGMASTSFRIRGRDLGRRIDDFSNRFVAPLVKRLVSEWASHGPHAPVGATLEHYNDMSVWVHIDSGEFLGLKVTVVAERRR